MPVRQRAEFIGAVMCAVFFIAAAWVVSQRPWPKFPPFERPVMELFASQDVGMVLNGARRLGADLAFIQLLQYYGSPENASPDHPRGRYRGNTRGHAHETEKEHEGHQHQHMSSMGSEASADETSRRSGAFPQLLEYTLRAGSLDPRFHFIYLFSSGALAFNLNRGEEAMEALSHGARADPNFWRYRLYMGAMAYRKNQEIDKAIASLEEASRDPDCPSMIKNILANIHVKQGNFQRAREIYSDLLNSRDRSYTFFAEQQLRELP
jgi:tetratricopeptide (TPR) repeat protein